MEKLKGDVREEVMNGKWKKKVKDGRGNERVKEKKEYDIIRKEGLKLKEGMEIDKKGKKFELEIMKR